MTTYTLFSQGSTGTSVATDTTNQTMGVQFSVSTAGCTLTAIWFYSATGAVTLPATIALYAVTGTTLITSQAASWSGAAASGWVRATFTSPPSLTSAANYRAAVFHSAASNWYSATSHYWEGAGAGASGLTNGPLSAPNSATAGQQSSFHIGASLTYPGSQFNATNYWVDPEITPAAAGGGALMSAGII